MIASTISAKAHPLAPLATTRTQFMAETSKSLRRILEKIRDDAQQALSVLGDSEEPRSLAWRCKGWLRAHQTFHAAGSGRSRVAVPQVRKRVVSGSLNLLTNDARFVGASSPRNKMP